MSMVEIKKFETASDFLKNCEAFLCKNESENNLIFGLANAMANNLREFSAPLHVGVLDGGQVIGAALRTDNDKPLSITRMSKSSIDLIVNHLIEIKEKLVGVLGESISAEYFCEEYSSKFNMKHKLAMHQGIYQADSIIMPDYEELKDIQVNNDYMEDAISMISGFIQDCFPEEKNIKKQAIEMAKRHIKNKALYFLINKDNEVLSMASNNRNTLNTACISHVYTPPKLRGRGHGSLITAMVSKRMLHSGKKYCNLFTNLENPTSNSIYQKIGYKLIGKSKHFNFLGRT